MDEAWWEGFDTCKEKMNKKIEQLEKQKKELEEEMCNLANKILDNWCRNKDDYCPHLKALENQIEKMETEKCLSVDCDKAKKNGDLCLGYGGDEDEPCEQCKNCIKCETGYYQLGKTEKDEQLNKLQEQIEKMKGILLCTCEGCSRLPKLYETFDKEIKEK